MARVVSINELFSDSAQHEAALANLARDIVAADVTVREMNTTLRDAIASGDEKVALAIDSRLASVPTSVQVCNSSDGSAQRLHPSPHSFLSLVL